MKCSFNEHTLYFIDMFLYFPITVVYFGTVLLDAR